MQEQDGKIYLCTDKVLEHNVILLYDTIVYSSASRPVALFWIGRRQLDQFSFLN